MNKFRFSIDWLVAGNDAPEYRQTMAMLALHVCDVNLMKNEDIWSSTIRESVLASAYPLAMWLASSWWRLNWEPLPAHNIHPSIDWRMAHELGAANRGFVWPQVLFASDREVMQVWAVPSSTNNNQSVRHLNGLAASISLSDFQRGAEDFIASVLDRLDAVGYQKTDLASLWEIIQEERIDQESAKYRRVEAELGYDPDECPEELMDKALALDRRIGTNALSELAPVYGKSSKQASITVIEEIVESQGLVGVPRAPRLPCTGLGTHGAPWRRAVATARALRQSLGNTDDMVHSSDLCELLGLNASEFERWSPSKRYDAAVAVPSDARNRFKFIPRKKHRTGKRFELARFIGDYLLTSQANGQWLASTDLSTSRQKYQRAFAAEFLCPIASLQDRLQEDYSEEAIEEAAQYFQVSQRTVESLLINNRVIPSPFLFDYADSRLPYSLGISPSSIDPSSEILSAGPACIPEEADFK